MTYIQKFTLGIIFTFFSINMIGCSGGGGGTTVSTPPAILVSPALDFNFGTVTDGNVASPLEVIITNIGAESLLITEIAISDIGNFQLDTMGGTSPCTMTSPLLVAGDSCTIEVTFNPGQFSAFPTDIAATLTIKSNDPNSPNKILNLAGTSEKVTSEPVVIINQVETADCPTVIAYVSVTDQSNFPVEGLSVANFTIKEDGADVVSPTISTVGTVTEPISIAIVMDNSSSMQAVDVDEMNNAAKEIIELLTQNPNNQAEIIKFDKTILLKQPFTTNKILLDAAIDDQDFNGSGTALFDALQVAINDTDPISGRKAIIVITDGSDTKSINVGLADIIDDAQIKGIPIYVIALGDIDPNDLANVLGPIATDTSGEFYEADVAQNFRTIIEQQLTEVLFTDQYRLEYTSGSNGGGTVDLIIDITNLGCVDCTDSKSIPSCP